MEWLRNHPDQTEEARLEFVRAVILMDVKVRKAGADRWREIQRDHPGTRYDEFKAWEEGVWLKWFTEKMKSVKRKYERRKKMGTDNHENETPLPGTSSSAGHRIRATPSQPSESPSRLKMSGLSIETPSGSRHPKPSGQDSHSDDNVHGLPRTTGKHHFSLARSSTHMPQPLSKRRRTGDACLQLVEGLLRDGYLFPDQVIELGMRFKAEGEGNMAEVEGSEEVTPSRGRQGSIRRGRQVISPTPDRMVMDETTPTPRSAAASDEIPSGMGAPPHLDSLEPMDGVESTSSIPPEHQPDSRDSDDSCDSCGDDGPQDGSPLVSGKPKGAESHASHLKSRRTRVIYSSTDEDESRLEIPPEDDDEPAAENSTRQRDGKGEAGPNKRGNIQDHKEIPRETGLDEDGEYQEEEEDDEDDEDEEYEDEVDGDEEDGDDNPEDEESEDEDDGDEEYEDDEDEDDEAEDEDREKSLQRASSKPGPSYRSPPKSSEGAFYHVDLDESAEETFSDLESIKPDPIPDPGIELAFPENENVPPTPRLEAEDPSIQLDLDDLKISDESLREKLYGSCLFSTNGAGDVPSSRVRRWNTSICESGTSIPSTTLH